MVKILKIWPIIVIGLIAWLCESVWINSSTSKDSLSNSIEAKDVSISSKVRGRISKIYISEGDLVNEGQILLVLDGNDILPQLKQAKANVLKVEMELNDLLSGYRKEELEQALNEKNLAQEVLKQSRVKFINSSADFDRIDKLYQNGATSKQNLDKYYLDKKLSELDVVAKEKLLNIATEKDKLFSVGYRPNLIRAKRAELDLVKAKCLEYENLASELNIISPISGEVSSFDLKVGEVIQPNQTLATVTDLSDIFIRVYVSSSTLGKIMINDSVNVSVDAYPSEKFVGMIKYISAQAEFTPRNVQTYDERSKLVYPVKITLDNRNKKLRDGMYAVVKL